MFENLDVYQKAVNLADRISPLRGDFPLGHNPSEPVADRSVNTHRFAQILDGQPRHAFPAWLGTPMEDFNNPNRAFP